MTASEHGASFWPMFGGSDLNRGYQPSVAVGVDATDTDWIYRGSDKFYSSPALVDGSVYIGDDNGTLHAIDAATGKRRWRQGGLKGIEGTPAVADGKVFVGGQNNKFRGFDAQTGDQLWSVRTGDAVNGGATVNRGVIYFGDANGGVFALNGHDGSRHWHRGTPEGFTRSAPAIDNDRLYICSSTIDGQASGDDVLLALDRSNGETLWKHEMGNTGGGREILGTPVVVDSTVLLSDASGSLITFQPNGEVIWKVSQASRCTPAADNTQIYIASSGELRALSQGDGSLVWRTPVDGKISSQPTVCANAVLACTSKGKLVAVDKESGEQHWQASIGGYLKNSPVVTPERIILGSGNGTVTAVRHKSKATPTATATATQPPTEAPTETPTQTPSLRGRLGRAETIVPLPVGGEQFFALKGIPEEPAERIAFVNAETNLLEPTTAVDAAIAYTGQDYGLNSSTRLQNTKHAHKLFQSAERMARAANIVAELSGALALAKIDPVASVSHAAEAVQDGVTWSVSESSNPYEEQFAKMAATATTASWATERLENRPLIDNTATETLEIGQVLLDSYGAASGVSDIPTAARQVRSVIKQADSVRSDISGASVDDLKSTSYTLLAGLAVDSVVGGVTNVAEAQARTATLGKGNTAVRIPLLNEIIRGERKLRSGRAGFTGVLYLQSLRQTEYHLEATALRAMARYQSQLSSTRLSPAYEALYRTDNLAAKFRSNADAYERLGHYSTVVSGQLLESALQTYRGSLNQSELGPQEVFSFND